MPMRWKEMIMALLRALHGAASRDAGVMGPLSWGRGEEIEQFEPIREQLAEGRKRWSS
jgi:hypothetical protein